MARSLGKMQGEIFVDAQQRLPLVHLEAEMFEKALLLFVGYRVFRCQVSSGIFFVKAHP